MVPEDGGAGWNMNYFSAGPGGIMVRVSDPKRISFLQKINQINHVIKFRKRSTCFPHGATRVGREPWPKGGGATYCKPNGARGFYFANRPSSLKNVHSAYERPGLFARVF